MARSTSNHQPSISVRALSKSYGRVQALHDVSFDVEHGKIFGLIGPDGSGKTTLFRILTTLLLADAGKASVDGFDVVRDMNDIRKRVGYMPGHFSLYQDLTVEENLKFFATLFATTGICFAILDYFKLYLYVANYGFTSRRLVACWFLLVMFTASVLMLIRLYKKFEGIRYIAILFIVSFILFAFSEGTIVQVTPLASSILPS